MKRRTTLKALVVSAIAVGAIGYWLKDADYIRDLLSDSFFKPTEQDTLMAIVDTILPKEEHGIGGLDVGVPIYLLDYLEHCEEPEVQANVKEQLGILDLNSNKFWKDDFVDLPRTKREELLIALSESESDMDTEFFQLMKDQTITGFRTAEVVMTEFYDYKVVPGEFNGCKDLKTNSTI